MLFLENARSGKDCERDRGACLKLSSVSVMSGEGSWSFFTSYISSRLSHMKMTTHSDEASRSAASVGMVQPLKTFPTVSDFPYSGAF